MSATPRAPRWPTVVSTAGLVLEVRVAPDELDDVLMWGWTEGDWTCPLGALLGRHPGGARLLGGVIPAPAVPRPG